MLFLPISFVTSYFSVQIPDLYNYFTGRGYWTTFGIVAGISLVSLFFFSRVLMVISDWLDHWVDSVEKWLRRVGRRRVESSESRSGGLRK